VRSLSLVSALLLGGCGASAADRDALDVYAASSLAEPFRELSEAFEVAYPGTDVRLTLAGSQVLRLQIEHGAPADVFASADPEHMQSLVDAGLVEAARPFASNELVVIVPLSNPAGVGAFEQLPRAQRIVLGTENVPAGRYAREVLLRASQQLDSDFATRVLGHVVSEESNVRLARAKVELGEADAALVYRTDAISSDLVRWVEIPDAMNVAASYVIGVVAHERGAQAAEQWVDFVLSEDGRAVLLRHGFAVE
jgi:molybdate transport system substrate-binding protein